VQAWNQQVLARQSEVERQGKKGTSADSNLTEMNNALGSYMHLTDGVDTLPPHRGFDFQYAWEGSDETKPDQPELISAVATSFNSETKVMSIVYAGALSNADLTSVLQDTVIRGQSQDAKRIEDQVFVWDADRMKAYEDAGFVQGGETEGVVTMFWGEAVTPEERQVYERREQERKERESRRVMDVANKVAADLDFDASKIYIAYNDDPDVNFVLNGREFKAAGLAYTVNPDPAIQGTIKLFPQQIHDVAATERVAAHEIKHIKFQNALDRLRSEELALGAAMSGELRGVPTSDIFTSTGALKPPYDAQYPALNEMNPAFARFTSDDFAKTDGVSNYSREYWKQFESNPDSPANYRSAMHETLAEMAATKYRTGKFPEHSRTTPGGPLSPSGTVPTTAERNAGTRRWRNLYRATEKVYQMGQY
jgi:hypothetical protein